MGRPLGPKTAPSSLTGLPPAVCPCTRSARLVTKPRPLSKPSLTHSLPFPRSPLHHSPTASPRGPRSGACVPAKIVAPAVTSTPPPTTIGIAHTGHSPYGSEKFRHPYPADPLLRLGGAPAHPARFPRRHRHPIIAPPARRAPACRPVWARGARDRRLAQGGAA